MSFKSIFFAITFIFSILSLNAQTIVFSEDFESLPLDLTSSGSTNWDRSSTLYAGGSYSDTAVVGLSGTSYLTSNSFNTTGNYQIILEFDQICKIEFFDAGQLEYSTDGGTNWYAITTAEYQGSGSFTSNKFTAQSYAATWQASTNDATPTNSWWQHETFNISSLVSNQANVKIRFKLADGNSNGPNLNYGWLLDNIKVTMSVDETVPPSISLITPYPIDTAYNIGPFLVKADIIDASGIDTSILVYTVNSATPDTLTMVNTSGTIFQVSIPAASMYDTIRYYLYATDSAMTHNSARNPVSGEIQFIIKPSPPPPGCSSPITVFPHFEDMETFSIGLPGTMTNGWTTSPTSGYRWQVDNAGTSSSSTGPLVDHTLGTTSGIYIYTEASSGALGDSAFVYSPCIDISSLNNPIFSFFYHRYGSAMGDLHVDIWYGNDWHQDIITPLIGQQQTAQSAPYNNVLIDLTPYKSVTQIRFRAYRGSSYYGDMALDDIRIFDLQQYDAAMTEMTAPISPAPIGVQDVKVKFMNFGSTTLTSATINWSVNGTVQTPYNWAGNLFSMDTTAEITVGTYNFTTGFYNIEFWTSSPNGNTDQDHSNDSIKTELIVCGSGLAGTYTINPSGGDFTSFTQAANMLETCGITAPVVFEVANGTYNEQVSILPFNGSSSTNTTTFTSASGNSSDVILEYAPSSSTNNYTFQILGGDYITLKNMTFKSNGAAYSRVLRAEDNTTSLTVDSMTLQGAIIIGNSTNNAIFYSSGDADTNLVIKNSTLLYGSYAMYIYGYSSSYEQGLEIINNSVTNYSYAGIYAYYHNGGLIEGNTFTSANTSNAYSTIYGIRTNYFDNGEILSNKINSNGPTTNYGMYVYYCDASLGNEGLIANNFIVAGDISNTTTVYGIYSSGTTYMDIAYNSVNILNNASTSRALYLSGGSNISLFNNIFNNHGGGYAYYIGTTAAEIASDYNNLYTSGANLAYWSGVRNNLTDLQTASSHNINSFSINPAFISTTDLHCSSISLDGAATPIAGITTDIDGDTRNVTTPDIGADEYDLLPNDLTISEMTAPITACNGSPENVNIRINNVGLLAVSSAKINWSVNAVPQTPFYYGGTLATGDNTIITVGSYTFLDGTTYSLEFIVDTVNGVNDQNAINDTLVYNGFETSISGTLTIGSTGDYLTINDAVDDLILKGVCAPVIFNIQNGNYTEQVIFPEIIGSSAVNTITFQAGSGNATDVTYNYASTGTADNYVFKFNGGDYFTIKNISLTNTGSSYARVIDISGGSENATIDNCIITGLPYNSSSTNFANIYSSNSLDHNLTISNNIINNGSYGMYIYGSNSSTFENGTKILNNTISNFGYRGIYCYYQNSPEISENVITQDNSSNAYSTLYGIQAGYCDTNMLINGNTINLHGPATNYGIYLYYNDATPTNYGLVKNNFVTLNSDGATSTVTNFYCSGSNHIKFLNNSSNVLSSSSNARGFYLTSGSSIDLVNNILVNEGGAYALYIATTSALNNSDYNDFYTTGANIAYYSGAQANLTDWQTATGKDANSISMDPNYFFPNDLHSYSPLLNNLGTPLTDVNFDIDGDIRDAISPDIGADEFTPANNDLNIIEFTSPIAECPGLINVDIRLFNNGLLDINSAKINWSIDGVPQAAFNFGGILTPGSDSIITLGTTTLTSSPLILIAIADSVNGTDDQLAYNDTAVLNAFASLSGVYTIGSGGDFLTINDAVDTLNMFGVCTAVTFNILTGTYNEQFEIYPITGASSTNTVTFQSASGDSTDVIIQYSSTSSANNYVAKLNACEFIRFHQVTMSNNGTSYARVFDLAPASNNTISNCVLNSYHISSSSSNLSIIYTSFAGSNNNLIESNVLNHGAYGIRFYGASAVHDTGNVIQNNFLNGQTYYPMYIYYQDDMTIHGNTVKFDSTLMYSTNYGLRIYYPGDNVKITSNNISIGGSSSSYGIYLGTSYASSSSPVLIANNFITIGYGTSSTYCIYLNGGSNINIFNNSLHHMVLSSSTPRMLYSSATGIKVLNNILYAEGNAQGFYFTNPPISCNYNDIYTTGNIGYVNSATYSTFLNWNSNSGYGAQSLSLDPGYAGYMDLHINNDTLNGSAIHLSEVPTDIDNEIRAVASDIGADEFTPIGLDATITWLSPAPPVSLGSLPVEVIITNVKTTSINSVNISYTDGTTPVTETFSSLSLLPNESDTLTFTTNYNFAYTINLYAYINSVNSVTDDVQLNDTTANSTLCTTLAGTYTIDPGQAASATNFTTINNAVDALLCGGISASVRFEIANGTYNEQINLSSIVGAGPGNNITFTSSSGNATDVIISDSSLITSENFVVKFNDASYICFDNITLKNNGNLYTRVFDLSGETDSVKITNNIIIGKNNGSTSTNYAVIYSSGFINSNTVIEDNTIQNGSYGIYMRGVGTTNKERGTYISGNTIENFYYEGIYSYYQNNLLIKDNTIISANEANTYSTVYGIYTYYSDSLKGVYNNQVKLTPYNSSYGMYFGQIINTATFTAQVYNNMISLISTASTSSSFYGTYFNSTNNMEYDFNSINIKNASTGSDAIYISSGLNIKLRSNNIMNTGLGTAIYVSNTGAFSESDYNNLYSDGAVLGYYTGNRATLADWVTASSKDSHSISLLPQLFSANDLHVLGISLMTLATPISHVLVDIDGDTRDALTPDIGADEYNPYDLDAGIIKFDEPNITMSPGLTDVSVTLFNYGNNVLTSADIAWTFNGSAQTTYSWNGSLAFANEEDSITLGSVNLTGGVHYFKSWSEQPNAANDMNHLNDTTELTVIVCDGGLKGNYIIGATGDFLNFNDAVSYMEACGIDSVVIFDVQTGTYPETVSIPYISGMADTSTITFRSQSGNASDVIIQPTSPQSDMSVLNFDGAEYVSWENMTIQASSFTTVRAIIIKNTTKNISIHGNIIELPDISTGTTNITGIYDNTNIDSNLRITNNTIHNGSYGMYIYGSGSSTLQPGLFIDSNNIIDYAYYGLYIYYTSAPIISNNNIFTDSVSTYSTLYGLRMSYADNGGQITGNNIQLRDQENGYGVYMSSNDATSVNRLLIANNFISLRGLNASSTSYAIYFSSNTYTDIVFNSIHVYDQYTSTRGFYVTGGSYNTFKNNNVANTGGGYALYFSSTTSITESDYNNIYTSGTLLGYYSGARANLSTWQTATSDDAHSYSMDPLFVSNTDLHIFLGSLDGKATPFTGVSTDIDGQTRNLSIPDIGADEFDGMTYDLALTDILKPTMSYSFTNDLDTVMIEITNYGANNASGFTISYSLNGIAQATENYVGTVISGHTATYTFLTHFSPNAGVNDICAWVTLATDGDNSNDTLCTTHKGIPTLNLPYLDDFESNDYFGANSTLNGWEYGSPAGTIINSAHSPTTAWVTNLDGAYNFNQNIVLYTPKFNFTGSYNAELRFYHHYDIEAAGDIGYIQYSNNNGLTWNDLGILNDPSGSNWFNATVGGLTGWNGNSGGWTQSTIDLSAFDNSPFEVQFRFIFYSDFSGTNGEGWAIDNFEIYVPIPDIDAGITQIISPSGVLTPGSPESITVRIQNFGANTLTSIPVVARTNTGQPPISATWSGTLPSGDSIDYTLPSSYTPLTINNFEFCAYTDLSGDLILHNDTTCIDLTTVGINEINTLSEISINPNPASNYTILEFNSSIYGNALISINTPNGKLIKSEEVFISNGINKFKIETHMLSSGIYIWSINNESISNKGKLIILR